MMRVGKRLGAFLFVLCLLCMVFQEGFFVYADDTDSTWAQGTIRLDFGFANPDYRFEPSNPDSLTFRDIQYPNYAAMPWLRLPYLNGSATLLDSQGQVVESYTNEARHEFKNLPAGEYTIRIDTLDLGFVHIFRGVHNGAPRSDIIIWSEDSDLLHVTVEEGNTTPILRWVVLEYDVYGFKTVTDVGTFSQAADPATPGGPSADGLEYVYYGGGTWYIEDYENPQDHIPYVATHDGIYRNESASLYKGMSTLQVPTLSEREQAKGYTFKGWMLEGDASETLYTSEEALAMTVRQDIVLRAVWEVPTFTVEFDSNGGTPVEAQEVENLETAEEPEAPTREGFVFDRWTLNGTAYDFSTPVTEDITLVAQWKPYDPVVVHDPPVKKIVSGEGAPSSDTFSFVMEAQQCSQGWPVEEMPMPEAASNGRKTSPGLKAGETYEFGELSFTEAGTYVYTIQEENGGLAGYEYDGSVYTITYTVTENGTQLVAERSIQKDGAEVNLAQFEFTNIYTKQEEPAEDDQPTPTPVPEPKPEPTPQRPVPNTGDNQGWYGLSWMLTGALVYHLLKKKSS